MWTWVLKQPEPAVDLEDRAWKKKVYGDEENDTGVILEILENHVGICRYNFIMQKYVQKKWANYNNKNIS